MTTLSFTDLGVRLLVSSRMRVYRHILLQMAILCITFNIFWDVPDHFIFTTYRFWTWLGYNLSINLMLYANIYVLAPHFLIKNKLSGYLLSVTLLTLSLFLIMVALPSYFREPASSYHQVTHTFVIINILSGILTVGLLTAGISTLLLYRYWLNNTIRADELESNTLQAELKFLKNQINPHFLFNMLNNANVLIRKNPTEATQVLFKLQDLLRYQFNSSNLEKVNISSEIEFMNDFLNLEKIRRDDFNFTILQEDIPPTLQIPPLLFIPFVENAVKHNNDSDNSSYVNLTFKATPNQIDFHCENSKPLIPNASVSTGGLGMKNIQRRLELLFPNKYILQIEENDRTYNIHLHIILN